MGTKINRRTFIKGAAAATAAGITGFPHIWVRDYDQVYAKGGEIKVGVLFSLTGTTALVEKGASKVTEMAIDEINAKGGVLGKKIVPIIEDPASDPKLFSEKANKLIVGNKVSSVFGSYTTASRKAALPVFEKRKNLYIYPTFYEGFECSKHVIYTGAVPNQQLQNFVPWIVRNTGKKKFFLVGSDYMFPRGMARVVKILLKQVGGEWVADEYLELGHSQWASMVAKIKHSGCDCVFSSVVGDSIIAFYREYKNQGMDMEKIPIFSDCTSEIEVQGMGAKYAKGSYTSFPYFQTVDTPENHKFVEAWKRYAGKDQITHTVLDKAYFGVFLWAQGVEAAGEVHPIAIREGMKGQETNAPGGRVRIEPQNLHTWLTPRIGKARADGQFDIVNEYPGPIMPLPYAEYGESAFNLFCTEKGLDSSKIKVQKKT